MKFHENYTIFRFSLTCKSPDCLKMQKKKKVFSLSLEMTLKDYVTVEAYESIIVTLRVMVSNILYFKITQ